MLTLELVLALLHVGDLPVPGPGKAVTLMHLPVILAGVFSGPLAGALVGLVFGISTYLEFPPPDLLVHLVPRILMGVVAGLVFVQARRRVSSSASISGGAFFAAISGSLTNTLGVTLIAALQGYNQPQELMEVILLHGLPEAIIAVVVTVPLAIAVYHRAR
jgi:uncharacterized membrane protein